jgi:hypothetical protein
MKLLFMKLTESLFQMSTPTAQELLQNILKTIILTVGLIYRKNHPTTRSFRDFVASLIFTDLIHAE